MRSPVLGVLGVLLLAAPARGGEMLTLEQKAFGAAVILEVRLPLELPIPANWPNKSYDPQGQSFPAALIAAARKQASVERVLKSPTPEEKPALDVEFWAFSASSPCWWKAHERGGVKTLLFLKREEQEALKPFFGVEHETGLYTDLNPRYEELAAAIIASGGWHEERMRAVAAEMLWQDERAALGSDNPYLAQLAAAFLREHEAAPVVDEVWGLPGTEARGAREKALALPYQSVCKP